MIDYIKESLISTIHVYVGLNNGRDQVDWWDKSGMSLQIAREIDV